MTSSVVSAADSGDVRRLGHNAGSVELGLATTDSVGGGDTDSSPGRVRCLVVPLGATEQHGPHLPLSTDTIIATAWAASAAARVDGVVVAPALPYGSSGEHQGFHGTLSIGREALALVITELVRSAAHFCDRVVFVSGHGGNVPVLESALARLTAEGHDVTWFTPRWPPDIPVDAHAGETETSILLHLQPNLVGPYAQVSGNTTPVSALMPTLATDGVSAVTVNGVLGDPRAATAELGAILFQHLVDTLVAELLNGP